MGEQERTAVYGFREEEEEEEGWQNTEIRKMERTECAISVG